MKKKLFLVSLFLMLLFVPISNIFAQTDKCSYVCRVPESVSCKNCKGEPLTPLFGGSSNPQPPALDPTDGCQNGINTAIGCISVLGDQNAYLADILRWAVGVGGGIAFLLIVYAGFMILSSAGNPERLKAGQELMTSAISGVVLLVLSIFVLRVIGVDILKIPGFGG